MSSRMSRPEVHPGLLPAGELVKGLLPHGLGDGQAVAYLVFVGVRLIAAPGLKGGGELVIPGQNGPVALPGGHPPGQVGHLTLHLMEGLKGGVDHILHGVARRVDGDLGDEAQALARGDHHFPFVIVHHPGENAQQGGLAAAVGAQQSHPLAGVHLKGEPVQYFAANLKFLDQVGYRNVDHSVPLLWLIWGRFRPWGGEGYFALRATHFANSGKVGKAPFKGEMFRIISPLKIPLSATKKRVSTPFFDFSPGMGGDLSLYF